MIKGKKNISDNSSGIQADRDINIKIGLGVEEVKNLTLLYLKENFPKLREDAIKTAEENVKEFINEFEKKYTQKRKEIYFLKFSDPDIQNSINDATLEIAKRGRKSNINLLTDLVFEIIKKDNNDLQSLVAAEAIKIVSQLNVGQINHLSIMVFFEYMSIPNCTNINQYDMSCKHLLPILSKSSTLSGWNLQYLESKKCLIHQFIGRSNIFSSLSNKNKNLILNEGQNIENQIEQTKYFKLFTAQYEKHRMNYQRLTIIGSLIGAINIKRYLPESIDLKNFIK